jgi:hypothetical protein
MVLIDGSHLLPFVNHLVHAIFHRFHMAIAELSFNPTGGQLENQAVRLLAIQILSM